MASPGKPLPEDLQTFLNQDMPSGPSGHASHHPGAVFASLGTTARLTNAEARGMAANLAALHRPVLWKISDVELPGTITWSLCKHLQGNLIMFLQSHLVASS